MPQGPTKYCCSVLLKKRPGQSTDISVYPKQGIIELFHQHSGNILENRRKEQTEGLQDGKECCEMLSFATQPLYP